MFGEKYPNFILRANPDAALSLARGVFEFFGHWLNINIIGDFCFKRFAKNRQIRVRRGLTVSHSIYHTMSATAASEFGEFW